MKIAYISAGFDIRVGDGEEAAIKSREMVLALSAAGHAVWVICPASDAAAKHEVESSKTLLAGKTSRFTPALKTLSTPPGTDSALDDVMLWPVLPREHHLRLFEELETLDEFLGVKTRMAQTLRGLLYNLTLYDKALQYLRQRQIDFIYERYSLFGHAGLRLAKALGVPHFLEVSAALVNGQEQIDKPETKTLAHETARRLLVETDRIFVVSHKMQDLVVTCGVPVGRICVLPIAVDPQRFDPQHWNNGMAVRTRYHLTNKRIIGFVGELKSRHGIETLIAAFRRMQAMVPDSHLLIVGGGAGQDELTKYAQAHELQEKVSFTGDIFLETLPHYIAAMDIVVAPGIANKNFDDLHTKILESMVMGKPVVAADVDEAHELISSGVTGALYEPGNVAQLATTLVKLAHDKQLCRQFGDEARAWVQKNRTWENNAKQVTEMAQEFIEKRRSHEQVKMSVG